MRRLVLFPPPSRVATGHNSRVARHTGPHSSPRRTPPGHTPGLRERTRPGKPTQRAAALTGGPPPFGSARSRARRANPPESRRIAHTREEATCAKDSVLRHSSHGNKPAPRAGNRSVRARARKMGAPSNSAATNSAKHAATNSGCSHGWSGAPRKHGTECKHADARVSRGPSRLLGGQ